MPRRPPFCPSIKELRMLIKYLIKSARISAQELLEMMDWDFVRDQTGILRCDEMLESIFMDCLHDRTGRMSHAIWTVDFRLKFVIEAYRSMEGKLGPMTDWSFVVAKMGGQGRVSVETLKKRMSDIQGKIDFDHRVNDAKRNARMLPENYGQTAHCARCEELSPRGAVGGHPVPQGGPSHQPTRPAPARSAVSQVDGYAAYLQRQAQPPRRPPSITNASAMPSPTATPSPEPQTSGLILINRFRDIENAMSDMYNGTPIPEPHLQSNSGPSRQVQRRPRKQPERHRAWSRTISITQRSTSAGVSNRDRNDVSDVEEAFPIFHYSLEEMRSRYGVSGGEEDPFVVD